MRVVTERPQLHGQRQERLDVAAGSDGREECAHVHASLPRLRYTPGMTPQRSQLLIDRLGLQPHSERGYFAETYRAAATVHADGREPRSASTAIYFLVTAHVPSTALHRLRSDEVFHLYEGGPLDILRLAPDGSWDVARLGLDIEAGERPQIVIAAGTWFGTELTGTPRIASLAARWRRDSTSPISN